ncbi:methylated-DNA--[protein]-cysteine S-methyltransferase [Roseibium litorale]|uniref:Methylated-DNA--protein-cysteine methyltransferase n=1 Tax=Roseibium litorale TaxID=2803841 RepID=A0ABR9CU83_9HYPH|nr:methylated-DNA--[protein]-cysteine S-methyltransferase [Roseibium litorale]MBD8893846.1 methylated-DNA--[protein]-cysteine S-methyltransferase [Roseibium litorale]
MPETLISSPFGILRLHEAGGAITALSWTNQLRQTPEPPTPLLTEAVSQLSAYFAGKLTRFDLPLDPKGGDLNQAVFRAMLDIPFGETRTYGEIARQLGTAAQPVGQACGANPIPIIIPCHRILSAQGLGGYSGSGGLETKIALLKLEGSFPFLL